MVRDGSGEDDIRVGDALGQWRTAERSAAVARRGRVGAQAAAKAAGDAEEAAAATAKAAKTSLESATLAEASAAKTAASARLVVESTRVDSADMEGESALADVEETRAHDAYRRASKRASTE